MIIPNLRMIFRPINYWLMFNVALILSTNLSHWEIPLGSWINVSLYFLLFLLCFYIFKKDRYNKDVYLNLTLLFFFHAIGVVSVFVGNGYPFGNNNLAYYMFEYRTILLSFLLSMVGLYFTIKYLFYGKGLAFRYGLCLLIVSAAALFNFHHYLFDKSFIFKTNYVLIFTKTLYMGILPFLALLLYGYLLYKYDRPYGEYTNQIICCFFLLVTLHLVDSISTVYRIRMFAVKQYILFINLGLFAYVFFKKLNYTYSEFGEFYEDLLFRKARLKVLTVQRRKEAYVLMLNFLKTYLSHRKNFSALFVFLFVFFMNFFNIPLYIRLNILVAVICIVLIFIFSNFLYNKRMRRGNFLPH